MNQGTSGVIAIAIFAILLFLFITALATAPANQLTSSSAGTPFVLPVAPATGVPGAVPAAVTGGGSGQAASAVTVYTVQSGEWLQVIAERYNTTVNAILALNPQITQPSTIRPGQQITIPVSNAAP